MKFCGAPWKQITVQADGTVRPCLCGAWTKVGVIGNILKESMADIMRSNGVVQLRDSIKDQSFSLCNDACPYKWTMEDVDKFPEYSNSIDPMPNDILMSIDYNCNLKCASCRAFGVYAKSVDPTARRILDRLVESYRDHDRQVVIQMDGAGDVFASEAWKEFLRRNDIPECFKFHIITNGNLVTKNKDLVLKHRDRITAVDVSLDSTTDEVYSQVRGGKLSMVTEGMRWMRDQGIPTTISFVVQRRNYHQMMDCWKLAQDMGCHSINFQGINRYPHMTEDYWQYTRLEGNPAVDMTHLRESLTILANAPTVVDFTGLNPPPVYMDGELRRFI